MTKIAMVGIFTHLLSFLLKKWRFQAMVLQLDFYFIFGFRQ